MIYIFWFRIQVNNAAIVIQKPTVEVTAEEFSTIMAINFESVYHLSQLAHPLLKASGAGSIVFISSVAGVVSIKYLSAYSVTKGISLHDPHYIYIYCKFLGCGPCGLLGVSLSLSYCDFSGAMNQLTKNLACEWAEDNIRSNAVAPWYIKTPMVDQVIQLLFCFVWENSIINSSLFSVFCIIWVADVQ